MPAGITLTNCSITAGTDHDVITGTVHPLCLSLFELADYRVPYQQHVWGNHQSNYGKMDVQFERTTPTKLSPYAALLTCTRGEQYITPSEGVVVLLEPCFVIDGLSRLQWALAEAYKDPANAAGVNVRVQTNHSLESEKQSYICMSIPCTKVGLSVQLALRAAEADEESALTALFEFSKSEDFAAKYRVGWNQNLGRYETLSGITFIRAISTLHSHIMAPESKSTDALTAQLEAVGALIGIDVMIRNTQRMFELVSSLTAGARIQTHTLDAAAALLSANGQSWEDHELVAQRFNWGTLRRQFIRDESLS